MIQSQYQEKWETFPSNFLKVYNYQKKISSGQNWYFQMNNLERKNHLLIRFPKVPLAIKVYNAIAEWYPRYYCAVDPGNLSFDSSSASPTHGK